MNTQFASIAIIGKYMDQTALQSMQHALAQLATHLAAKGVAVWVEENTAKHAPLTGFKTAGLADIGKQVDLVIVMGGDGTMLSVARTLYENQLEKEIPLVGINRGRLGFLTDLRTEDMLQAMDKIIDGQYQKETRMLLDATVTRAGKQLYRGVALNDVVVKSAFRLIELEIEINGQFVSKQRADGLILSTPTGTTAYALSAGGPILHPDLDAISLVPISPHTLSNRPITVASSSVIELSVVQASDAHLSFDGQNLQQLEVGDTISVRRAKQEVSLIHPQGYCYFDMLRNKLNWG